jgi:hypothetical protein
MLRSSNDEIASLLIIRQICKPEGRDLKQMIFLIPDLQGMTTGDAPVNCTCYLTTKKIY